MGRGWKPPVCSQGWGGGALSSHRSVEQLGVADMGDGVQGLAKRERRAPPEAAKSQPLKCPGGESPVARDRLGTRQDSTSLRLWEEPQPGFLGGS